MCVCVCHVVMMALPIHLDAWCIALTSNPIYFADHFSAQEVDVQLKAVCEKFISEASFSLTAPIRDHLAKCDVIFQLAEKDRLDPANTLHQQPFAKAGIILTVLLSNLLVCRYNTIPTYVYTLTFLGPTVLDICVTAGIDTCCNYIPCHCTLFS